MKRKKCYKTCYWSKGKKKLYCDRFIEPIRICKNTPIGTCYTPKKEKQ